jgi:hypothetical protein
VAVERKVLSDAPEELQGPIREFFPQEQWDNAASVAYLESGWHWDAENDSTQGGRIPCGQIIGQRDGVLISAEHSIGYFQINACNHPDWNPAHLFNVRQNVGTAHAMWSARGWAPWYFSSKALGIWQLYVGAGPAARNQSRQLSHF